MIARLQMSDLHLGDPRSVLSDPATAQKVVDEVARLSGGQVEKLILAGDVWEENVPGDLKVLENGVAKSVKDAAAIFFGSLYAKIKVDEIVVVPGNHDVCTWHWYREKRGQSTVTNSEGESVEPLDWPWFTLLGGFCGKLTFAYPLYWDKSAGVDYPVLFVTHGHLLDPLVLGDDSFSEYNFLSALGVRRPMVKSLDEAESVKEIAQGTLDFCLGLWKRYSVRDYIYANYIMRRLEHPESCLLQGSSITWIAEESIQVDDPSPQQGNFANVPSFLDLVVRDPNLPTPVGTLGRRPFGGGPTGPAFSKLSCLTFGHDHRGTWKRVISCGVPFVAADSGGWTSEWDGHIPHTHVLVWCKKEDVVPAAYLINLRQEVLKRASRNLTGGR